jgi:hypothetical protein
MLHASRLWPVAYGLWLKSALKNERLQKIFYDPRTA